jgi:hypothetical protein
LVRVFGLFVIHSALTWSAPLWSRAGAGHQHLHLAVTHRQTEAESQLGVDAPGTVGAPTGGMHGKDLFGQPNMSNRALGRWP